MKKEARVVATFCEGELCAGVVVRLDSVDGIALSTCGCGDLCERLSETGYLGEVRYELGLCRCGLEVVPPEAMRMYLWALDFAEEIVHGLSELVTERPELLTCRRNVSSGAGVPEPGQRGRA
ncbi:MAG: hypothetical protein ACP5HK_02795 [Acidilobus sp.]